MNPSSVLPLRPIARTVAVLVVVFLPAISAGENWPGLRGPRRDAVSAETSGWPKAWPPETLWKADVGEGAASPVLADGKLYALGFEGRRGKDGRDVLRCYDANSGQLLWSQAYKARYQGRVRTGDTGRYGGPLATPTLDADTGRLFTLGVDGYLACWDTTDDGKELWSRNLYDDYRIPRRPSSGGGQRDFGLTCSPLLLDGQLLVEVGHKGATLLAMDPNSGKELWRSQYAGPAGHTPGPVPLTVGDVQCVALLTLKDVVIIQTGGDKPGRTVATYPWATKFACNIPCPAVAGEGRVVVTSAYNQKRSALLEVAGGKDKLQQRWLCKAYSTITTAVVHDGSAYVMGSNLAKVSLKDGKVLWKGGRFGLGSFLLTADGKIIATGGRDVVLADADGEKGDYKELARLKNVLGSVSYSQVALSEGRLAVRDKKGRLVVLSLRTEKTRSSRATPATQPAPDSGDDQPLASAAGPE